MNYVIFKTNTIMSKGGIYTMKLFEKIHFSITSSEHRLTSKNTNKIASETYTYNQKAIQNTNFSIAGSVESFHRPPISDFALNNLFHMQSFDIFHYNYGSFTERIGFDSFLLLYTYSGNGSLIYNNKIYHLSAGDGFFIDCKKYHLYKVEGTHWDTGILHMNGSLLQDFYDIYGNHNSPLFHENFDGKIQLYIENILMLYQTPQLYRDWQVSTYIDRLLNHLLLMNQHTNQLGNTPENITYLIKYIESNYVQPLSLDFLAQFANLSKYHLAREFKKYTGFSPTDYIISLRIDKAKYLLENTTLTVYSIAHQVGIHDINNFTNLFKKKVGLTPTQFRKLVQ